ncbi:MAG: nitroreductase family protein [Chloroflexota bacterium]|nr:nitroreductase family protein [Chloroflexota bacterium]
MQYNKPVTDLIKQCFSCRSYLKTPIEEEKRQQLEDFLSATQTGPFSNRVRFKLVAATPQDSKAQKGLGTYGFIRNPRGFIISAVEDTDKGLEDLGYAMERIVLFATDLGLGTCWLGGTFTKGRFAQKISARDGELIPIVTSIGYAAGGSENGLVRQFVGGAHRKPWDKLFFDRQFGAPISRDAAGAYDVPLEMVRLGPSASNKQPWRIVKDGSAWHFYLQRTPGYRSGLGLRFVKGDDLQRIDMGIAMSHFELTANELGLLGEWRVREPSIEKPDELAEYTASWVRE